MHGSLLRPTHRGPASRTRSCQDRGSRSLMVRFWQVWPAVLQDQVRHGSPGVGVEPIRQSRRLPAPFDLAPCGHAQKCRTHRVRRTELSDFHATVGDVAVSYTHLRAHETRHDLVCRLLLEKKKKNNKK